LTEKRPADTSMSSGAASSWWATIFRAFSATLMAVRFTDSPPTDSERDP